MRGFSSRTCTGWVVVDVAVRRPKRTGRVAVTLIVAAPDLRSGTVSREIIFDTVTVSPARGRAAVSVALMVASGVDLPSWSMTIWRAVSLPPGAVTDTSTGVEAPTRRSGFVMATVG